MSRGEELAEAMATIGDLRASLKYMKQERDEAEAALSVLTPLLKRVAEGLEPFAASAEKYADDWIDWPDGERIADETVGDYRTASSLHQELKGLLS